MREGGVKGRGSNSIQERCHVPIVLALEQGLLELVFAHVFVGRVFFGSNGDAHLMM